jgi:hypothetical protein
VKSWFFTAEKYFVSAKKRDKISFTVIQRDHSKRIKDRGLKAESKLGQETFSYSTLKSA